MFFYRAVQDAARHRSRRLEVVCIISFRLLLKPLASAAIPHQRNQKTPQGEHWCSLKFPKFPIPMGTLALRSKFARSRWSFGNFGIASDINEKRERISFILLSLSGHAKIPEVMETLREFGPSLNERVPTAAASSRRSHLQRRTISRLSLTIAGPARSPEPTAV